MTMKYLQHEVNPSKYDYIKILSKIVLDNNIYPLRHAWETDSKKVLHLHVLLKGNPIKKEKMKKYREDYNCSLHVRRVIGMLDKQRILEYLDKQDLDDYEVEQNKIERDIRTSDYENIFLNHNMEIGVHK